MFHLLHQIQNSLARLNKFQKINDWQCRLNIFKVPTFQSTDATLEQTVFETYLYTERWCVHDHKKQRNWSFHRIIPAHGSDEAHKVKLFGNHTRSSPVPDWMNKASKLSRNGWIEINFVKSLLLYISFSLWLKLKRQIKFGKFVRCLISWEIQGPVRNKATHSRG